MRTGAIRKEGNDATITEDRQLPQEWNVVRTRRIPMKRWIVSLATFAAIILPATLLAAPAAQGTGYAVAADTAAMCMAAPIDLLAKEPLTGDAFLCADADGVSAQIRVAHLTPGNVYTAWFSYVDQRASCTTVPCDDPDFLGDNPPGVNARMDGVIADETGKAKFVGDFPGFRLSNGSEVQLVIFTHGKAADNGLARARQLLTPQDPGLGSPMGGAKADGVKGSGVAIFNFDIG
jgi:hypothetical protein